MDYTLLEKMGLGGMDLSYLLIGMAAVILVLLILVIVLFRKLSSMSSKYEKFMQGKDGKSLESQLMEIAEDNRFLKNSVEQDKKDIRKIYKNLEITFQKAGLNKYDAFHEMGGKLSYCLALLNDQNDGFILNSVHSTDGNYSYAKVIRNGTCNIELGAEEQKALDMALGTKE